MRELGPLALVCLSNKVLPAPAVLAGAVDKHAQRAQRQNVIGDDEVLKIQNAAAWPEGRYVLQDVKAQDAGHDEDAHQDQVHNDGRLSLPAVHVHAVGNDVFHDGDNGGQGSTAHEDKEEAAPDVAHGHLVEDIGKSDEDKAGA